MILVDKWDIRFMKRAQELASWSKDPSTKVGAVIVKGKHAVAEGYNGITSSNFRSFKHIE